MVSVTFSNPSLELRTNVDTAIVREVEISKFEDAIKPAQIAGQAKVAAIEAEEARIAKEAADKAAQEALDAQRVVYAPVVYQAPVQAVDSSELVLGTIGYAKVGGNCVNEPGVNNPHDGTNPISWLVTSISPWIGASALFYNNHVAVVTGVWSNGDIEVRHQNVWGGQHRYPRNEVRGYR